MGDNPSLYNDPSFYNGHNLYIKSGFADDQQIARTINSYLSELNNRFPGQKYNECKFRVNLVKRKDNSLCGFGYVWVSDTRVYNIMANFDPDGKERTSKVYDCPFDEDFDFMESSLEEMAFKIASHDRKLIVTSDPILNFSDFVYEYTDDQRKSAHKILLEEEKQNAEKEGRELNEIPVPVYGSFEIMRARSIKVPDEFHADILFGFVPNFVTDQALTDIFHCYGDKMKIIRKPYRKDPSLDQVIVDYRYSVLPCPGVFSLQMNRKIAFVDKRSNEKKKVYGNFNYCEKRNYKTN